MAADLMRVNAAKVLRGNVVEILYRYYGTDISLSVLRQSLRAKGFTADEDLVKAFFYLAGDEKRYIHVELAEQYWDSVIWLTPKGINLAEGDIQDVGVILDE